MTRARPARSGRLVVRAAVVLVAVALLSVTVFAVIVFLVDRADVRAEGQRQQQATVTAVTAAAVDAYRLAGGWQHADLSAVKSLAAQSHLGVRVTTLAGSTVARQVGSSPPTGTMSEPLRLGKSTIGTLTVTYPPQPLSAADRRLRSALEGSVLSAAGVAAAAAVLCAVLLARPLTRPLVTLTAAVRRHAPGESPEPSPARDGPGEIGELSRAFRAMLADLEHHQQLRRALVADIAHELRTPIAILQAETEAILDGVSDLTPAAAMSLHEEILRLARLVEDLQTLAAAQAARLDLRNERLDLAEIAAAAGESQQRSRLDAGLTWEADLTPVSVKGDPLRLHQVVTNLLTNAIKYTPPGGQVRLTVRAIADSAVLEVQDTGPGIPADELPHIFERFHRGAHDGVPGSGIGLAVTAELVAAHHGTITITSPALGGTRATVHFPLAH